MRTLILTSIIMILAIGGLWTYAQSHADQAAYEFLPEREHGAPAAVSSDDEVVIRVNGEPITMTEFDVAMASFPENARAAMFSSAGRKVVAEELISLELLAQKARSEGLDELEDVRNQIERSGVEAQLVRKNILAQAAIREMAQNRDQERSLQQLYERVKSDYEMADTRQIVIGWQGSRLGREGVTRSKEEAQARAREAVGKLRAGADFGEVHREFGDNPQTPELGPVRRDSTPPDLAEPIFSLQAGETSEPIETPWGYHIFQVTARSTPAFEEIEVELQRQAAQLWTRVALEELREGATVEFDDEFFGEGQ